MWIITEHRSLKKLMTKLPSQVLAKYELWKTIVYHHGPDKLKQFQGFHDEVLTGGRKGQRSSRLNLQYRVIYTVKRDLLEVNILDVTPHDYRRK